LIDSLSVIVHSGEHLLVSLIHRDPLPVLTFY
jgi:hypothetical protein